jgi:glycerol-3-phosphate dehydrogenase
LNMDQSSLSTRNQTLGQLARDHYDVLVIGGGIVGSGVARDAAQRGLRTALVDRHDFAFGTSSRSSRMLHGGLRYLEQGRIGLVREASLEKKILRDIAPHLGDPLGFVFPAYKKNGRPLWQLRVGVKLYDLLCNGKNFGPSRGFSRTETTTLLPGLNRDGLLGAVRYYDALTNDARLVLDTLRASARHGGTLANYINFIDATRESEGWCCSLKDHLTGESLTLRTRTIVNATGPWAQGLSHSAVKLRLSKGIHLVIDRQRFSVTDPIVITEGKRILFVIPWGERVIVGTTDTDYVGAPEDVAVDQTDIAYVLRTVNAAFPALMLTESDIVSSWAGLRPLIANPDGSPSDISRAHQIRRPEPGWWDIAGGKLTTYRLMAEQTVDQLVRHVGRTVARCRTADEPLLPTQETTYSGILPAPFTRAAVSHYLNQEWAVHLDDVMVRRSGWHYYHADSAERASTVASWMTEFLGWSAAERERELAAYHLAVGQQANASPEVLMPGPEAHR